MPGRITPEFRDCQIPAHPRYKLEDTPFSLRLPEGTKERIKKLPGGSDMVREAILALLDREGV